MLALLPRGLPIENHPAPAGFQTSTTSSEQKSKSPVGTKPSFMSRPKKNRHFVVGVYSNVGCNCKRAHLKAQNNLQLHFRMTFPSIQKMKKVLLLAIPTL